MDRRDRNMKWWSRFDEATMTLFIEDGEGGEVAIPAQYAVCGTCDGKGKHVNPGIDSNGLTQDDFDEQGPDFREDYFSGVYDVPCNECDGARVSPEVADDAPAELKALAESWIQDRYDMEREYEAERRMGA